MSLQACPFCRQLFVPGEQSRCEDCDVDLVPLTSLPPSLETLAEAAESAEYVPPEDRLLPWSFPYRGRAVLLGLASLGLVLFFVPWLTLELPDPAALSGFDLARSRIPWLWGGAIGWFLLLALVASRRTVRSMRGIRVVCATFSAMTFGEVALLLVQRPLEHSYFASGIENAPGLYLSGLVSAAAILWSARFGGKLGDVRHLPLEEYSPETSDGQLLH
jgi:hypothetical protein